METSAPDPAQSAAADDGLTLAAVLDRLALGLTICDRDRAALLYRNAAAALHDEAASAGTGRPDDPTYVEQRAESIEIAGRTIDVLTTLDMTDYAVRENELTRRAFYDELTGLPKRELLERTIDNMIVEGCAPFALAFIDVDNFKYVNDYYGHAVGDQLLKKIARRISDSMRPTDLLARVGGDEFVLMTTPIQSLDEPAAEIEHLAARFREPFFIDGYELFSSASIGVSIFPVHGKDYAVLRGNADNAMYRVKGSTKGAVSLFDASLGHAATERMEAEQRLRFAIRDRRLSCAFQPKVDFRTDEIVGVEVLLRWLDENGDIRPPGGLINVAIELGLMDEIALIVLDQVTSQIHLINDTFGPQASISVNIAAKQATDLGFMTKFAAALRGTGYPERFILELTEEAFLSKSEFQRKVLPMLRDLGVKVSIDDFGVGYSSLSALAEITADELKVDRSFITDIHKKPRNQAILKVIELLGSSLGMRVIVEGVETVEELTYLMAATRINCAQGYYFSKPIQLQGVPKTAATVDRGEASALRARGGARGRI